MAYQLLLSDADNTLFDFTAGERIAVSQLFRAFSIPDTTRNVEMYHRINHAQWLLLEKGETTQARLRVERFRLFLEEAGYAVDPQAMSLGFVELLGQQRVLMPGALDFCRAVAEKMPLYIVTNGIAAVQRNRFENCPLSPYFSALLISEEIGAAKPDPAMVREGLRRAGVAAEHAVLLGDSVTADIAAANGAGVDSVLFTNGAPPPPAHCATYAVPTLEAARAIVLGEMKPLAPKDLPFDRESGKIGVLKLNAYE